MKKIYVVFLFAFFTIGLCTAQDNVANSEIEGFKLYPNPVTADKIYISTAQNAPKQIIIFDVLATKVMETTILGKELNVSNLDKGVYILRVIEKDKMATRKLIIK